MISPEEFFADTWEKSMMDDSLSFNLSCADGATHFRYLTNSNNYSIPEPVKDTIRDSGSRVIEYDVQKFPAHEHIGNPVRDEVRGILDKISTNPNKSSFNQQLLEDLKVMDDLVPEYILTTGRGNEIIMFFSEKKLT